MFDMTVSDLRGLLSSGMDYVSDMMPERDVMKSYIDGPYDDYVIDKVGDGYNYLRGLLDDGPSSSSMDAMIGGRDPMTGAVMQRPPSSDFAGINNRDPMTGATSSPRIADLFERKREPATRPKLMNVLAGANRRAPRPMTWGAAAGSVPEEFARLSDTPRGTPESMYRQMSSPRSNPMGLLSGEMTPEGFTVEEAVVQPMPEPEPDYFESTLRDRVRRGQQLGARQMAADARIRNALAR